MADDSNLKTRWNHLYREHLPSLAKARDPVQAKWPVYLDHCFARIILDAAVGIDKPWTEVVKQPAVKHMTDEQFIAAIELGERIATGEENLVDLDDKSLAKRNKTKKRKSPETSHTGSDSNERKKRSPPPVKKQKAVADGIISAYFANPAKSNKSSTLSLECPNAGKDSSYQQNPSKDPASPTSADISVQLKRISSSTITPFRKKTLSLLCQIPTGRYTTYQAISDHVSQTSHQTCARAVGSAIRNNPFAPEVPCHRVLASDGSVGGFKGSWGKEGEFAGEKVRLLREEGVRFDSNGKVVGRPFKDFVA